MEIPQIRDRLPIDRTSTTVSTRFVTLRRARSRSCNGGRDESKHRGEERNGNPAVTTISPDVPFIYWICSLYFRDTLLPEVT